MSISQSDLTQQEGHLAGCEAEVSQGKDFVAESRTKVLSNFIDQQAVAEADWKGSFFSVGAEGSTKLHTAFYSHGQVTSCNSVIQ